MQSGDCPGLQNWWCHSAGKKQNLLTCCGVGVCFDFFLLFSKPISIRNLDCWDPDRVGLSLVVIGDNFFVILDRAPASGVCQKRLEPFGMYSY